MTQHREVPARHVGEQGPFRFVCMENTTTRNAFWCVWVEKTGDKAWVCTRFGRIGTKGRTTVSKFNGYWAAFSALEEKMEQKYKRKYTVVVKKLNHPTVGFSDAKPKLPSPDLSKLVKAKEAAEEAAKKPKVDPGTVPYPNTSTVQDWIENHPEHAAQTAPSETDCAEFDPLEVLWG